MNRFNSLFASMISALVFCGPAFADWPRTTDEVATGVFPTALNYPHGDVRRYGAVGDGAQDNTLVFQNALLALNGKGIVTVPKGVFRLNANFALPSGTRLRGQGFAETAGVASRAATVLLKSTSGTGIVLGDDAGLEDLQVDSASSIAGDGVFIKGSRVVLRNVTVSSHAGNGVRVGADGMVGLNANLFHLDHVITISNGGHGLYIHHSNTNTSASYPQGAPDVNAGTVTHLDTRGNGGDGVRVRNAIDNKFFGVTSQSNAGAGIRLEADARGHQFYGLYTEANAGGEFVANAGTRNNIVIGNRAVAVNSNWIDNGTGNYVLKWDANVENGGWNQGPIVNVVNPITCATCPAKIDMYQSSQYNKAAVIEAMADSIGTGGKLSFLTKRNGDTPVPRLVIDSAGRSSFKNAISVETAASGNAIEFRVGTQLVGSVVSSPTGVSLANTSDRRAKLMVRDVEQAIDRVMKVHPKSFRYHWAQGDEVEGFLADEVARVVPSAVFGTKDATDAVGQPVFQTVDYAKLVPVLWAALRDLSAKVEQLEASSKLVPK
jgi:hypothetical protein